ncbi:MAG: hypothetical protein WD738_02110 [Pirellulales bacterium]
MCWILLIGALSTCAVPTLCTQCRAQWQLWKINTDGSGLAQFVDTPGYHCGSPEWSPDGKYIAFDTWPVDKTWSDSQVAIVPADGSKPPRLLGPGAMPSFSPDGTQLVCHTYPARYGTHHIVVMNADGSGREAILDHWGSPRWSPRGNRIATVLEGNIALFDLATGKERTILPGFLSVRQGFCISPDGRRFCFANMNGGLGLATLDNETMRATVRPLVNSGTCYHASFAPGGERVVVGWDRDNKNMSQLYLLNLGSHDVPTLLPGQDTAHRNVNPDWSPDGTTIVFASQFPIDIPLSPK